MTDEAEDLRRSAVRFTFALTGMLPWVAELPLPVIHRVRDALLWQCGAPVARLLPWISEVVCVRCAGIYLGLALGALLASHRLLQLSKRARRWFLVALGLLLSDVVTEQLGWRDEWAASRLATGVLLGAGCSLWVIAEVVPVKEIASDRDASRS